MASLFTPLHVAAAEAVASHAGVPASDLKVEATPRPELGDLAVGCFAITKVTKQPAAEVAQAVAAAFQPNPWLASATAAGPFVNFRVNRAAAFGWLADATRDGTIVPQTGAGETICIDFGSPNISKHLAYHHIRGTTIGHALARTFRALGSRVVGINFLGDWGTTHGMVIAAYEQWGDGRAPTVELLDELYKRIRAERPDAEDAGRAYLKRLEAGEPEATALWRRFREVSWAEFEDIYKILGIAYDDLNGESFFWRDADRIVGELRARNMLVESEGAQVVELPGEKTPILLITRDGTTLYATRDVAAAEYRERTYHPTRSLYVVDRGQSLHFRQLFKLLGQMGYDWAKKCEHVPYGLVRAGGKKTGTRLGNVVLMREVFAIAEDEVRAKVNSSLAPDVVDKVARDVGIGAIVFANLAPQRDKDIDFDLDKAVSIEGDSGPYLQYSHARCASILRKAPARGPVDLAKLTTDAEWAVARRLLEYPEHVVRVAHACEPHVMCHYLLELAGEFSRWYTAGNSDASLRVLVDDAGVRDARLALVEAVQRVLAQGLGLLGLAAPDQM